MNTPTPTATSTTTGTPMSIATEPTPMPAIMSTPANTAPTITIIPVMARSPMTIRMIRRK